MDLSSFNIKFKLFGVPIVILPGFWILCIIFSPFMSMHNPDERPWLFGAAGWVLALLVSFLAHELGHALTARRYFGVAPEIALGIGRAPSGASVFGGVTTWRTTPTGRATRLKRALVSGAGPWTAIAAAILGLLVMLPTGTKFIVNFEFGFLPVVYPVALISRISGTGALDLFIGYFSLGFFWINIFWSVVNLLPIYPLDGGQIMLSLTKGAAGARRALYVSTACAILVGGLFMTQGSWFAGLFFLYMGFVNYQASRAMEQM